MAEPALDQLRRMRALTRQAHAGQTRNNGRIPYWVHTDAVAQICWEAITHADEPVDSAVDLLLAAYGHDLYEDTSVSRELIRREFGLRVDTWIADLTNERGDANRDAYLRHLLDAEDEVRVVKCADLIDNMLSVAYGVHDLGLPWVRSFFLPIAVETRAVLNASPFQRLALTGERMLERVDWAWARLEGSIASASGQEWAKDLDMAASAGETTGPAENEDDEYEKLRQRLTFTPEQSERIREKRRREREEEARRLFGDRKPFAIPDVDTDA
jgi:hypothetical protein